MSTPFVWEMCSGQQTEVTTEYVRGADVWACLSDQGNGWEKRLGVKISKKVSSIIMKMLYADKVLQQNAIKMYFSYAFS